MKKYLIALTALMVSLTLFAAPRTAEEAAALAARFTNQQPSFRHLHRAALTANDLRLVHQTNKPASTEPALYVFNKANNGGFVMVSADDNAVTILGYSDEGSFDADRMPENVRFWLDYYAERVAKAQPVNNTKKVRKSAAVTTTVSPLLDIEGIAWNQSEPYNNMCPEDAGGRCVTGCVATAAAQIMRYWKWPVQGNGSHSYSWNGITLSVNFGSATYDWDNMLPNYTGEYTEDQANAVAQLMYHAGVACNMSYSSDASSAYTENMGNGMINYFRYKSNGYHTQWYTSLSLSEINTMFIEDLLAGRPILMGGAAADRQSGHEFVCDGIDADGLFHINWGWGGSSNGFFALSALDPDQQGIGGSASGSGYSNDIDFMIGLEPDGRAAVDVTGISVAPTTLNLDIKAHEQLSFTVTPANANNRAVTWSSQDENIAIVDATGNVTGLSAGTTTITATTLDGSHSASCIVTVSSTIASAIELTVNWGYAEYDAQYVGINMPWSYILRNINTNGQRPLVVFWPHYSGTNGIAGTYELYGQGGYMRLPDSSTRLNILSGQLVVTCIGKNNGDNGCNTYHFLAYFTCDDGQDYKVDATIEMCAEDPDGTAITLSDDNVGDGTAYEVTWMANGQVWEKNIAIENKLSLPAINPAGCGEKVFVGWSATELATETDVIPTFAKNGNVISANTTYYAVYAVKEGEDTGSNDEFVKINTAAELTNGNYLVVGVKNGYYAMKNAIKASYYIEQQEVSPVNDVITTTDGNIIWQIIVNNNTLSFYNEAAGNYVYLYVSGTYKDAGLTGSTSENIHFSYTVNNGVWDFINTGISGLHLEYYGQKSEFAAYTSAGDPIYLYKQTASGITYSAYSTVCVEEGTAVEQIRVAPTALKRLEDGKIVILLGNEKYTIFGQKIK